jgi:hypothetical protein
MIDHGKVEGVRPTAPAATLTTGNSGPPGSNGQNNSLIIFTDMVPVQTSAPPTHHSPK